MNGLLHGFYILPALIGLVDSVIAAFLAANVALIVGQPSPVAAVVGVVAFVVVLAAMVFSGYRGYTRAMQQWQARFPSPAQQTERE